MKIAPIYMTKRMLVNRLNKRNAKIASDYVEIAKNLPSQSMDTLNKFRLSLAKFARRNHCQLSFSKDENGTRMDVLRNHLHWYQDNDNTPLFPLIYSVFKKEGGISLPHAIEPKNVISAIKKGAKAIIENIKDKRTTHFHSLPEIKEG